MAVGFEWQCRWKIYKSANAQQQNYFPKNTVLTRGIGWKLVTDGADMEFVTDPVPLDLKTQTGLSMDGETSLVSRMASIKYFCQDLDSMKAKASIDRADKPQLFSDFPKPFVIVPEPANGTLTGFVQVSGGIRLTKLRKFFKAIGTADSPGSKDFLGMYHSNYGAMLRKVHLPKAAYPDTAWAGHAPSAKMRSLAELIAMYINQFKVKAGMANPKAKVVKYMAFIMARTNFARLFQEMEGAEVVHYSFAPNQWVRYICTDIMKQIAGYPPTGADPAGRLIEYKINDMDNLADNKMVTIPITRKEWLKAMAQGKDLLTAAVHPTGLAHPMKRSTYRDAFGNHRLRGVGGLGNAMDTLAMNGLADNQGAIFEFRGQQSNLNYNEWAPYCVRVYRFLQTVNFGQQNP
ncbi:MAG: hypothetical protein ACRD3D_00430 [Terriglobia bacterium]